MKQEEAQARLEEAVLLRNWLSLTLQRLVKEEFVIEYRMFREIQLPEFYVTFKGVPEGFSIPLSRCALQDSEHVKWVTKRFFDNHEGNKLCLEELLEWAEKEKK